MTSGGDAPGMNAVVRAVARMAMAKDCEPYAIREGYEGLVQGGDLIQKISWEDVRGYLSEVPSPQNLTLLLCPSASLQPCCHASSRWGCLLV